MSTSIAGPVTVLSSTVLRLATYVFLRWIPGHVAPPVILTAFAIYVTSFFYQFTHTSPYEVVADELDIITRDTIDRDDSDDELLVDPETEEPLQEIDVQETIVVEEKDPQVLRSLLTGLPSPSSLFWSAVTFLTNVALLAMVADMVYRAPLFHPSHNLSFVRLGHVSENSAKLLVREPRTSEHPLRMSYRYAGESPDDGFRDHDASWKHPQNAIHVDESTDYTGIFHLTGLRPDTTYQYAASNNHTGFFVTAPRIGRTAPRNNDVFTFLHSSCIKPRFPYNPVQHPLEIPGFKHLARLLPSLKAHFMVFMGDFIYADVPKRFGTDAETYRREYRQVYSSPQWESVSSEAKLPWIHVLDDHEIANDWDKNTTGVYEAAVDPWHHYQASVNPEPVRPGATYFSFNQGPTSFFMIDTRRYREPFDGTDGSYNGTQAETGYKKSMLGDQQLKDLLDWLAAPVPNGVRWKVVVSSIPFTKNWRFGSEDTWGGYLGERQIILEAMWDVGLRGGVGVVVLSGDRHEFAATSFPPPTDDKVTGLDATTGKLRTKKWPVSATVHEFSVSPLSMFYLPVRTYEQTDNDDVCVKYMPDGNSKFGALSISTPPTSDQSELKYRLFIDGQEAWSHKILTPPVVHGSGRAIPSAADGEIDVASFFPIFDKYIYALISDEESIRHATTSVLEDFQDDGVCYLELRTTPRAIPDAGISKDDYVKIVLQTMNDFEESIKQDIKGAPRYDKLHTKLILSIDRKNTLEEASEVVNLAVKYRHLGIVGVDLCGNPAKKPISHLAPAFAKARAQDLGITLHFGEIAQEDPSELEELLSWHPQRLGHVIHIPASIRKTITEAKLGLEICLSCNVLCKLSQGGYAAHHFGQWWAAGVPIALSTDDVGIFEKKLSEEYMLAAINFGLDKTQLVELCRGSVDTIFGGEGEKERVSALLVGFWSSFCVGNLRP
ncbi:Metallo-dependent phosphatase [Aureobasidium sp. EXF-10728]|nr:Metallo-dependent phosphatase [Aureobasidium sp. EXF-10728]